MTCSSLYKKLRNVFALPSISTLQKYSSGVTVEARRLDCEYLRVWTKHLSEREAVITLMIVEVYTAERVKYSTESFIGLTGEGVPSKTVLTFMV